LSVERRAADRRMGRSHSLTTILSPYNRSAAAKRFCNEI